MKRTRGVARVMAVGWVLAGGFVDPLGAEWVTELDVAEDRLEAVAVAELAADVASAVSSAVSVGCPSTASCGAGCTATLGSGFCSTMISWQGGIKIGGLQIGPDLKVQCRVCDCMYLVPGAAGTLLGRPVDFGCSVTFPGLQLF